MNEFSWRKRRILVVEDDAPVRDLLVRVLKDAGYLVVGADGPKEALDLSAQHTDLDLLITDMVMRGMNGLELARKIRESHAGVPVLLTSSYSPDQLGQGEIPENTVFVEKPWAPSEILEHVARLLSA